MNELLDHPANNDFWRHVPPKPGNCWVCGERTSWIYLDIGYQHLDCDMYPTENGDVVIMGGVL